jgi:hypothetical protein
MERSSAGGHALPPGREPERQDGVHREDVVGAEDQDRDRVAEVGLFGGEVAVRGAE